MKKYIMIFVMCIFLTGCSVNYDLTINDDLTVDEKITAKETEYYFDNEFAYYERKDAIDSLWNSMSSRYDKKYEYTYNSNYTGIVVNNKYNNIEEYLDSELYKQYFENINYTKNNNKVIIESTGEFYPYTTQDFEKYAIDNFELRIKVPFKMIKNNADNKHGDIYIWKISPDTKNKKIYLEFDVSKKYTKNNTAIDFQIIFGIIVIVSIIGIYVYYRVSKTDNSI